MSKTLVIRSVGFLFLTLLVACGSSPEDQKGSPAGGTQAPVVNLDAIDVEECAFYKKEDVQRYIEMANAPCLKRALQDGVGGNETHVDPFSGEAKILLALALEDSSLFFSKNGRHGHAAIIALLLEHGGEANRKFPDGTTLLERALRIEPQHEPVSLYVLHFAKTDVNLTSGGGTPLEVAIAVKRENFVEALLQRSAKVNSFTKRSSLPHQAIENDMVVATEKLIEAGADVNAKNPAGASLLQRAIAKERRELFELLLARGASFSTKTQSGETPLMTSIAATDNHFFARLLAVGADIHATDENNQSALYFAVAADKGDRARTLMGRDADVLLTTKAEGNSLLHVVRDVALAQELERRGARVDAYNLGRQTPLSNAVSRSHHGLVTFLLSKGASEKWTDGNGRTLLHVAVANDSLETTKIMLAAGIKTTVEDDRGNEPIFEVSSVPVFALLKDHQASASSVNKEGAHVLTSILRSHPRKLDLVMVFLENGAKPDADNALGFFPLHYIIDEAAVRLEEKPILLQALIRSGADPSVYNLFGEAPLHLVRRHENGIDLLKALAAGGARLSQRDERGAGRTLRSRVEEQMKTAQAEIEKAIKTGEESKIAQAKRTYEPVITRLQPVHAFLLDKDVE